MLRAEVLVSQSDKRKQSLYFPEEMLKEIQEEATRQDRSLSWVVQQAWKIARERIKGFPAVNDVPAGSSFVGLSNSGGGLKSADSLPLSQATVRVGHQRDDLARPHGIQ